MGSTHATCYSLLDDVTVVAVADLNEEVAHSVADKFGAKVYTDAAKLIEECELDALDICLPTFLHAKFAIQAMEKGIPYLFIEKPVAINSDECKQLLDAQAKSGAKIQIGQVLRFYDEYVYLKKLVDDKILFIMPVMENKFVKLVNRGEDQMREVQDKTLNQDMTYDYRYMFQMGVGVIINLIFGEWIIA